MEKALEERINLLSPTVWDRMALCHPFNKLWNAVSGLGARGTVGNKADTLPYGTLESNDTPVPCGMSVMEKGY